MELLVEISMVASAFIAGIHIGKYIEIQRQNNELLKKQGKAGQ